MALLYKFQWSSTFTDNQTLLCDKLLNNECKHKLTHKLFQDARWPSQQQLSTTCLLLLRSTSPVYIWIWHEYMLGTNFTFPGWRESDPIGKLCASDLLSVRSMRKSQSCTCTVPPPTFMTNTRETMRTALTILMGISVFVGRKIKIK